MKRAANVLQRWSKLTGRHKLAVAILGMQAVVTFRVFFSFDPVWFAAQSTNYATLTTSSFLFAAASLGIKQWGDNQMYGGMGGMPYGGVDQQPQVPATPPGGAV